MIIRKYKLTYDRKTIKIYTIDNLILGTIIELNVRKMTPL